MQAVNVSVDLVGRLISNAVRPSDIRAAHTRLNIT
jgi:hypothetical protein